MNNYICKIATIEEMNIKWDYEINNHPDDISWKEYKVKFIESAKKGNRISYYGILNNKIICEATAIINKEDVKELEEIFDGKTAYLCAFRTIKEEENKGYFGKLYRFMEDDLKSKGYNRLVLGVEPSEVRNIQIYFKKGFTNYLKSDFEEYGRISIDKEPEKVLVNYYYKNI
ncbi:MAG: GNAT family N-acetyltransferase [Tenericutes bacterium]|nr:GNAT family N-acetyltransferase [Mycoplasmatota bacterium]